MKKGLYNEQRPEIRKSKLNLFALEERKASQHEEDFQIRPLSEILTNRGKLSKNPVSNLMTSLLKLKKRKKAFRKQQQFDDSRVTFLLRVFKTHKVDKLKEKLDFQLINKQLQIIREKNLSEIENHFKNKLEKLKNERELIARKERTFMRDLKSLASEMSILNKMVSLKQQKKNDIMEELKMQNNVFNEMFLFCKQQHLNELEQTQEQIKQLKEKFQQDFRVIMKEVQDSRANRKKYKAPDKYVDNRSFGRKKLEKIRKSVVLQEERLATLKRRFAQQPVQYQWSHEILKVQGDPQISEYEQEKDWYHDNKQFYQLN